MNDMIISGKRKTAIAKAMIRTGNGKITINRKPIAFFPYLQQLELNEPILIARDTIPVFDFDIIVRVTGGGISSQIEAARLAIARAIVAFTKNLTIKMAFLAYDRNLLIADTRRKEAYKPGDSKARANRQTSYR